MSSVIQVNRIYLIFNLVHFLVDSSEIKSFIIAKKDVFFSNFFSLFMKMLCNSAIQAHFYPPLIR